MKLIIPTVEILSGGDPDIQTLVNDLGNTNSDFTNTTVGDNQIITDTLASPSNKINMDQETLLKILAVNGDMEEHLMAIRVDDAFAVLDVTDGLPRRKNVIGQIRKFVDWFIEGSEVWRENVGTGIIFMSNPAGGLAGISDYLKGSEMEIIRLLNTDDYSIMSRADADVITNVGWTQVDWGNL